MSTKQTAKELKVELVEKLSHLLGREDSELFDIVSESIINLANSPDDKNDPLCFSAIHQAKVIIARNGRISLKGRCIGVLSQNAKGHIGVPKDSKG